jgi:hypothetical protein
MKLTAAMASALAIFALGTHAARAGDNVEPNELAVSAKIRQAAAGTDGTLYLLEGTVGYRNNAQEGDDEAHAILVWDLDKNQKASELKGVPNGAVHMAVLGAKLVVACGSNGVVIFDLPSGSSKKVATEGLAASYVSPDSPPGKALLLCSRKGGNPGYDRSLVEVDLEAGTMKALISDSIYQGGHVAAAKDMLVIEGLGTNMRPEFWSLPEVRRSESSRNNNTGRLAEPAARSYQKGGKNWSTQAYGLWHAVNGGANFAATEEGNGVICLPSDCSRVLWTAEKTSLLAAHPSKPVLVCLQSDENNRLRGPGMGTNTWKLVGLHSANGKQVWKTTVSFDSKVETCWRADPTLFSQTVVSTKKADRLVFAVNDASERGRAASDAEPTWYFVDLPKVDLSTCPVIEGEPRGTLRVTESFSFVPKVTNGDKATFSLKKSPDGMTIDATTAGITWKPTDKQIGKHDVEVTARVGDDEFPVLTFEIKVTSADEFQAVEWDWGDLAPAQIVCSEDGASIFVLEAKKQGGPTPPSRIVVWDVEKKRIEKSINLPKSPEQMMMVGGKLLVSCPDSQVVALIDPKEKKVTKSVPISVEGEALTPRGIFRDGPPGKAIVACGAEQGFAAQTIELDLATGKISPLYFPGGGRGAAWVAVAKDYAVWSDGSWGGVSKLSELRKAPSKGKNKPVPQMDADERQFAPFGARAVNSGANFVAASPQGNKTALLTPDWKKVLWTVDGLLVQVHPTKPMVLVLVMDPNNHFETDTLTLRGINSQSNRQMWQLVVKLPGKIRMDYWSFARGAPLEIRASKDSDEIVFAAGADPFGRATPKWFHVALPNTGGSAAPVTVSNEPPSEVAIGETFDWAPTVKGATSPTFVLKTAPDGMTIDAKTGRLTWKPDEACIGKHDVLLVATIGQDEIPIAFELRVRPTKSGTDATPTKPPAKANDKPEKSDETPKKDDKPDKSDSDEKDER